MNHDDFKIVCDLLFFVALMVCAASAWINRWPWEKK